MQQLSKRTKRAISALAGQAYEEELRRALNELHVEFGQFERGEITPFDLQERIHRFHQGPARKLYNKYDSRMLDITVAHAIHTGILNREEIDPEVLEALSGALQFYKDMDANESAGPTREQ